jgi:hypothetical protein
MNRTRPPWMLESEEEKTIRQELARRLAVDDTVRQTAEQRCRAPRTGSPYDQLSDALMDCINDAVFDAIHSPGLAAALAGRGYIIVPRIEPGQVTQAPLDWVQDAADLIGASGDVADPMERIDDLYHRAWTAGFHARPGDMDGQVGV